MIATCAAAGSSSRTSRLRDTHEVVFLRSPHAHAHIGVDLRPAQSARGKVFTAADLPRIKPIRVVTQAAGARSPPWPPLATDKVRYVGEAIAACVAPTRAEAEDLAAAVTVDYRPLDAVVDAPAARGGSRPWCMTTSATTCSRSGPSRAVTSTPRHVPPRSRSAANTA